jgi:hypothetical protein
MKEIDLHGVRHLDVEKSLIFAINSGEFPVIVITGNSRRMKELVHQIVSRFDLTARESFSNSGRLVIEE